jgi:acyl-CoA thioester hydrolase
MSGPEPSRSGHGLQSEALFTPMPYEVDFTGYLSNTVAPQWLERMRLRLIHEHFSDQRLFDEDRLSVIARTEIEYLRPIRMGALMRGQAKVLGCLRSSWTIAFVFEDATDGTPSLRARQVGAFIDAVSLSPVRIPPAIQERIYQAVHHQEL